MTWLCLVFSTTAPADVPGVAVPKAIEAVVGLASGMKYGASRLCPGALSRLAENLGLTARKYTGTLTRGLSPEAYAVLHKHVGEKNPVLTPEEIKILEADGSLRFFETFFAAHPWIQKLNYGLGIWSRSKFAKPRTAAPREYGQAIADAVSAPYLLLRYRARPIYEKVLRDPAYELTPQEKSKMKSMMLDRDLEVFRAYLKEHGAKPEWLEPHGLRKAWANELNRQALEAFRLVTALPFKLLRLVAPIPRFILRGRSNRIFRKILANADYELTPKEKSFAKKANIEEAIEIFRKDLAIHGKAFANLELLRRTGKGIGYALAAVGMALGLEDNHYLSTNDSFDEKHPLGMSREDDEVELIFTSPVPHVSVRIGGIVYNYGQFIVQRYNLEEYKERLSGDSLSLPATALSGSHTRIRLRLTQEEIYKLRAALEADVGKAYPLIFPFNDCVSQTNLAIEKATGIKVPIVADRSQALTIAYYHGLKLAGSDRVKTVIFAGDGGNVALAKAKDAGINILDTLFFVRHAGWMIPVTPIYDRYGHTYTIKGDKGDKDDDDDE